jgi:hypothetical protein
MQFDLIFPRGEPNQSLIWKSSSKFLKIALGDKGIDVSYFSLAMGSFIFISTLVAITCSYSGMLFSDEWGGDPTASVVLHNLFAQHNEHRIFIPRLFFLIDKYLFAGSNLFTLTANIAVQLCTAIILIGIAYREESAAPIRTAWAIGLILGLLFSGYQYENLFWGFQISVFLVSTFAIAAFWVLAFRGVTWIGLLLAALLGTAATFSLANGILVLLILPLLAIALRLSWAHVMILATAFVVVLVIYLRGYHALANHNDPIQALRHLDQVVIFALTYLGAPITANVNSVFELLDLNQVFGDLGLRLYDASVVIGLTGCVVTAWYGYQMMRRPREFGPAHFTLLAMMAFVVGTAFVTALGRLDFSTQQAEASKYGTPVLMFWVAVLLMIWKARSLTWNWLGTRMPIFASLVLLTFVAGQSSLSATAREWRDRELWVKTALLAGANDLDAFKPPIYFFPEQIADIGRALREERLSPFNESWAMWRGTSLKAHAAITGPERCIGWLDTVEPIDLGAQASKTAAWRVLGWAWDIEHHSAIEKIVLVNNAGQVAGYALSRLSRPDVVAHEARVVDSFTGWAGHVVTARSGEIRAYGLIDHDRSACLLGAHAITGLK